MSAKKTILILVSLIIIAILALLIFKPGQKDQKITAINIPTTNQPTIGAKNAPIHIVAFEDLKCMACRHFNNTVADKIKKQYVKTGKAEFTIILISFLRNSFPAANTALCLRQQSNDYFFSFVDYVYHHQPPESTDWATIPKLINMAEQATPDADFTKLSDCMVKAKEHATIMTNLKLANKVMNNSISTPRIFINGVLIKNPTWSQMQHHLDKLSD